MKPILARDGRFSINALELEPCTHRTMCAGLLDRLLKQQLETSIEEIYPQPSQGNPRESKNPGATLQAGAPGPILMEVTMRSVVIFGSVLTSPSPRDIDVAYAGMSREEAVAIATAWAVQRGFEVPLDVHECTTYISPPRVIIPALEEDDPYEVILGDLGVIREVAHTPLANIRRAIRQGSPLTVPERFRIEVGPEEELSYTGCHISALARALKRREGGKREFLALFPRRTRRVMWRLLAGKEVTPEKIREWHPYSQGGGGEKILVLEVRRGGIAPPYYDKHLTEEDLFGA